MISRLRSGKKNRLMIENCCIYIPVVAVEGKHSHLSLLASEHRDVTAGDALSADTAVYPAGLTRAET